MSNEKNHRTIREMSEAKRKKREFPGGLTVLQAVLIALQSLVLLLYATGAWQVEITGKVKVLDSWDVGVSFFAIVAGDRKSVV